jgi:pyruvate formate lyase activating enzyme
MISEGKTGICKVRRNRGGVLIAETWGIISSMHLDPVEKKPLYHFYPGKAVLSIGSVGCNMHCQCCQNWQISQVSVPEFQISQQVLPSEILNTALNEVNNIGVAYTYNEPSMWYEYMKDIAEIVHSHGLKNIMVSNGYISEKPLQNLIPFMDAFNIDLKGFSDSFYRRFTGASLEPVLKSLVAIRESGKHLELTTLIVPGQNDEIETFEKMIDWIVAELGNETVLHLSRYHPAYKYIEEPMAGENMAVFLDIAHKKLPYVYAGNISLGDYSDTHCGKCHQRVIKRHGYRVDIININQKGECIHCGNKIIVC